MPEQYLKQMARLLQLHKQTHPQRIAARYGVTDEYVRQLWVGYQPHEMAPLDESLETLFGHKVA